MNKEFIIGILFMTFWAFIVVYCLYGMVMEIPLPV